MKREIRLSGSGGQGVILASVILGKAASIYDKKFSIQSQSYGPEARGGATKSDIIISDLEIMFPKIQKADYLLSLTQDAADKYTKMLKPGASVVIDADFVKISPSEDYNLIPLPLSSNTMKEFDELIALNVVALSAFNTIFKFVSEEALVKSTSESVPGDFREYNIRALEVGKKIAQMSK